MHRHEKQRIGFANRTLTQKKFSKHTILSIVTRYDNDKIKDMKRTLFSILTIVSALLMASCISSGEMASEYFNNLPKGKDGIPAKIYVCLPTSVIHTNQNLNQIEGFSYLSAHVQDSIIMANTKFLNQVDDRVFLQQFSDNLLYHLRRTGVTVTVVDNADELPAPDTKTFVLNIPQIEAEEFIKKSRSEFMEKNGTYYHYDYDLNGFSTNVWYLFGKTDSSGDVYYKGFETMDSFRGQVDELKNKKATVTGKFTRISLNDIYNTAATAGKKSAVLFVEKIVNDYLASQGRNDKYFVYSPVPNEIDDHGISKQYGKKRSFQKIEKK